MGMTIVVADLAHIVEQEQWSALPNEQWMFHHWMITIDFPGHTERILGKKRLFQDRTGQTIRGGG